MRAIGVCYDTGYINQGTSTHEPFRPEIVRRELEIIANELRCDAVRITGGHVDRLKLAASLAAEAGLEVWLCPFVNEITEEQLLELLADCAKHAEALRIRGAEVVLAVGAELSLFLLGYVPGATLPERAARLFGPDGAPIRERIPQRLNDFLNRAAELVRSHFGGRVTYACLPHEQVDWTPFDILATDAGYRSPELASNYRDQIAAFVAQGAKQGKPVAITEFGCATYRGAADRGPRGFDVVEWDADPVRLDADYERDEAAQAAHLTELLAIFDATGVDTAFWYCFARYDLPHRDAPREDLDLASPGLMKVLDVAVGRQEPKAAFAALAGIRSGRDSDRVARSTV
ncbi:hypothetical protein NDR87_32045 [Nocardia sp. CDC159]|uniref:Abortive infection protein n=1 Tax=Nocardia pulmonis TaxID=2951408 RepID=A0A9X2EC34_9NOCA|nr:MULTISPECIES: hypothetical protein [Nocardia]MCM6778124.1 hypothetical protein [Nocardia pulmonis]MCM6791013.1 hypothetical protein [Nocardia sp. CDC159]